MFQNWGFLITEIFILLLLAALLGLLCGWLIWGRRRACAVCESRKHEAHVDGDLDATAQAGFVAEAAHVNADVDVDASAQMPTADLDLDTNEAGANYDYDGDGVVEGRDEGVKPRTLDAPIGGQADDLKMIKGVGPKMEKLLHSLGFFHFDQVANWTRDELAWVDANLDGFHGRATRDEWVAQAKVLAAGGDTEFSKRVEGGDVY